MEQQKRQIRNLPLLATSFVGRTNEVAEITRLLLDPTHRLITLVGAGGIGKTRLGIQAAAASLDDFADGVYFIPLQAIEAASFLASKIADALNFPLTSQDNPTGQLINYLQNKEILLLLDNFEHLLPQGGEELLMQILALAPTVKLLVTSREGLKLQEEWQYTVPGLSYPKERHFNDAKNFSAVQLFAERAQRVRRDVSLSSELADIVRICQLVEGMPLAIELAASWAKSLSSAAIADEIQHNVDFLATGLRNIPERQRSMRAVFDYSWQLLSDEERDVFKRLSVFRDSFRHEAARQVAGASLGIISVLVDKSLLRWEPDGRYHIHELLRQYAAEQLVQSPEDVTQVYDLHCAYYADSLHQKEADMTSTNQGKAIQQIAAELENVRAAWQWGVSQERVGDIQKAALTYYLFCDMRGRFQEASTAFSEAIKCLNEITPNRQTELTLALLHVLQGWNDIRVGNFDEAKKNFEQSQSLYKQLDTTPPPGFGTDPQAGLALLAHILGNYPEAVELGQESYRQNKARNDKLNLQIALYAIGNAMLAQGDYEAAKTHFQEAYGLTEETGHRWMRGYILSQLGNVARALGHYDEARHHYRASFDLKQALNDPEGMAAALTQQGKIAWLQQLHPEAENLYRRSLDIYREISDRGGLARALIGLGSTAVAQGHYQTACQHFHQSLQIAADIQFVPLILSLLADLGNLLIKCDRVELGLELLTLVTHHPASEQETKAQAQQYLAAYESDLPADRFKAAAQRAPSTDLNTIIATVQVELAAMQEAMNETNQTITDDSSPPDQSQLIEPLTSRELEVLNLIAQGKTNQQIADALVISVGTTKWYTGQIYGKLGVSKRTQAVARARELKLLM